MDGVIKRYVVGYVGALSPRMRRWGLVPPGKGAGGLGQEGTGQDDFVFVVLRMASTFVRPS
jgi:hypothetical protein